MKGMSKLILVAPWSNKKAWAYADFICDGIDDEVEIRFALHLAEEIGGEVLLLPGTYDCHYLP